MQEVNLDKLIIIGDRVLIKPLKPTEKTKSGLYLPPGVEEKEKVQSGYVMKVGPGYPVSVSNEEPEPWKEVEPTRYIPLQVQAGDLAIFLQKNAHEVSYQGDRFFIVAQNGILMLERDEDLL